MEKPAFVSEEQFLPRLCEMLHKIENCETERMGEAAEAIYNSMKNGGLLHVFSTGHSHMIVDELFFRSGGLAPINPIVHTDFMPYAGARNSTRMERQSGRAAQVLDTVDMQPGDCILIASNTGINAAPVEAALYAKQKGLITIGITSVSASSELSPRQQSGLKLYEVCDIVIDNHVPKGDGLVMVPPDGPTTGGASTFASLFAAQRIVLKVENLYLSDGVAPPVFYSANIVGGDEHNEQLIRQYSARIPAL